MEIRSDVFFAHKSSVSLPQHLVEMLENECAEVFHHAEGTACYMDSVRWYKNSVSEIVEFYEFLDGLDSYDYVAIEACQGYPEIVSGDAGAWHSNPWQASKNRTGIQFTQE
mgnify:CR=1 FL=1